MISRQVMSFLAVLAAASPAGAQATAVVLPGDIQESAMARYAGFDRDREVERQDREVEQRDRERAQQERERARAESERDREDSLYERGTDALWDNRWDRALTQFTQLAELKGKRADAAWYWKAYAQNRLGQRTEALASLAELLKTYPNSPYSKQAKALDLEVRNSSGRAARPEAQADEELKLLALNSLAHTNSAEAVPMLETFLNGTGSPRLKSQALFVLAQINDAKARELLKNVAKGSSIPELQGRAIQYLGVHGGAESRATLAEIYGSSTDIDVKRRILRAFMIAGERDRLFAAAQTEKAPELRQEAVRQLGVMGANDLLWQMYQKETAVEVKRQIISAMQVGGNVARMTEIAKSEKDPELRRLAVRNLGLMGGKAAGDTLVELYAIDKDPAIRRTVVNALFTQGNAAALVALARKEPDVNAKKDIVSRLAMMDDPAAKSYMLELLK